MAFGIAVTDGIQVSTGTYGYIVRFSLHGQESDSVYQVQMLNELVSPILGDAITSGVNQSSLVSYPMDASCPDSAWSSSGDNIDIFLKLSAYPYVSTTRAGIWFYRNASNVSATPDYIDVPQEARELFKAYCFDEAYTLKGKRPKFDISEMINSEKTALGL